MLRPLFLYLSRNDLARRFVMGFPLARRASLRFVAGETLDDAMAAVRAFQARGIHATMDHLGENVYNEADTRRAADEYVELLERIHQEGGWNGHIPHCSVKLTQLGLDIGPDLAEENLERVVAKAQEIGTFVRIDMESSDYTDATLEIYRRLRSRYDNLGVVIQAYLYRSERDVRQLIEEGIANIRLCKGAYKEPPTIAFPKKADVNTNFVNLMELLLSREALEKGAYLAVATHDEKMIAATRAWEAAHQVPRDRFEFQMLHGIRRDLQEKLAAEGYTVRIYIPYGTEWYPYFMRRLAERPANVWFIVSNLFRR